MATLAEKKQIAIHVLVDGLWHRAFELTEQGERHLMAWEGCPLNELEILNPENILRKTNPLVISANKFCTVCYADELKEFE